MKAEDLRKIFPKGVEMPEALAKLSEYTESKEVPNVVCDFGLTDEGDFYLNAFFRNEKELAKQFVVFGKDGTDSLYGYWLYEGRGLADAPVVYLSAGGEGTTVLAGSLEEFLSLLALGQDPVGMYEEWGGKDEECEDVAPFRKWLKKELGISKPANGKKVIEAARKAHPDLAAWIEGRRGPRRRR